MGTGSKQEHRRQTDSQGFWSGVYVPDPKMSDQAGQCGRAMPVVLAAAADLIAAQGVDTLSMRELARRARVSHGAPAHHFGDRRCLLTALATDGFERLAHALGPSVAAEHFDKTAVAYVRFAAAHPGHFNVMFSFESLDQQDQNLHAARKRTSGAEKDGQDAPTNPRHAV